MWVEGASTSTSCTSAPPEETAADNEAGHEENFCQLARFEPYRNEKHQCGFCEHKAYWYCVTCFPDPSSVPYALCNVGGTGRACFAEHVLGYKPKHALRGPRPSIPAPTEVKKRQEREERATSGVDARGRGDAWRTTSMTRRPCRAWLRGSFRCRV